MSRPQDMSDEEIQFVARYGHGAYIALAERAAAIVSEAMWRLFEHGTVEDVEAQWAFANEALLRAVNDRPG